MHNREPLLLPTILLLLSIGALMAGHMAARYGLFWPRRLLAPRPPGIILHHSASPATEGGRQVDAALIDRWHARRGWGMQGPGGEIHHIGYHYVILADGTVEPGRPEWMTGAHCRGHNDHIGICVVGNFSSSANPHGAAGPKRPTPAQLEALHHLLCDLCIKYHLQPGAVRRHRDLGATACPGDRFPYAAVIRRLEKDDCLRPKR